MMESMDDTRDGTRPGRNSMFAAGLLLCFLAALVFANSFKNDFVGYDDQNLIVNNPAIRSLSPDNVAQMFVPKLRGNYQPIRTLSYAIDYAIWGARPLGFHLTNIVLHALTVVCVWLLLRGLLSEPVALLAAMLFAVHPIHVESVTWMSARKDLLSLAFFLLAILWYEKSESSGKVVPYVGSIIATALALLSKLTAVSLPFCILLLEFCRHGRPGAAELGRKLVRLLPHFLLVCLVVGLNFLRVGTMPTHGDALVGLEQAGHPFVRDVWLSMPMVVCRYIGLLLVPCRLSTHYDVTRLTDLADARVLVPSAFLAAVVLIGVVAFFRGRMALAFCIGWFVITFLPTSNLVPTAAMMTDRYMHIPSIGFAALLAMALTYPIKKMSGATNPTVRLLALAPALIVMLLFSVLTVRRNTDWRDTTSLFSRTLLVNPRSVDARLAIGAMYDRAGDYNAAIEMYRSALDIVPGHYRVLYDLGVSYMKKGWLHQAIEALEESRAANPDFLATHFNLALSYHEQGRYDDAIAEHREVLRINPRYAASHGDLGRIYIEMGEPELALKELNRALTIQPDLAPALIDRAGLLIREGRYEDAEQDIRKLASLGVDTSELREKLVTARKAKQESPSD